MRYIRITGLPTFIFAHLVSADSYKNELPAVENKIELCHHVEGRVECWQSGEYFAVEKNDICCNLYEAKTNVFTPSFHEHRGVGVYIPFSYCEPTDEGALYMPRVLRLSERCGVHDTLDALIRVYTLHPERKTQLYALYFRLLDEFSATAKKNENKEYGNISPYVARAKEYVYKHIHEPITQQEIAKHLNITPEYLCAVFKKSNDVSLMTFVNQIKLTKIRTVMQQDNLKLHQAAELYGYEDPNYVSRLFKKYYGENVTDYKKKSDPQ